MGSSHRRQTKTPRHDNPFQMTSAFNLPLNAELCQQISATAMSLARRDDPAALAVAHCSSAILRERIRRYGRECCLLHPAEVKQRFQGVTLAVYQTIERLYCSRLGRSIPMIIAILRVMALQAKTEALAPEAIWSMCLSLEQRRQQQTALTIQQNAPLWWIGPLTPSAEEGSSPLVMGVLDLTRKRVLAIQAETQQKREPLRALALYEAIVSERQPAPGETSGLTWHLPVHLCTPEALSSTWTRWSQTLNLVLEPEMPSFPFVEELRALWNNLCRTRSLVPDRWGMTFESALNATYGTSPLRTRERNERRFRHLQGYMADPAWLFPALRTLLPQQATATTRAGEIVYHGLHYADEVLSYWPETAMLIRPSYHTEATLWVYLGEEILCQAKARELALPDGSYRSYPFRR